MSKFDFSSFYGGYGDFAVNAQKYNKEQAIEIFEREAECKVGNARNEYAVDRAWVRHRAGVDEDYNPCVGWWLEYNEHPRSCVVWEFHKNIYDKKWNEIRRC